MKLERRYKVGVRLVGWAQGFGNRLYGGIIEFLREGHEFELEFEQDSGGDLAAVEIGRNWEGDGLLVFRYNAVEAKAWKEKGIKVVNLSAEEPKSGPRFPRVTLDNARCGEQAAEHLIELGLNRFAYWNDPGRTYSRERLQAFQKTLRENCYDCELIDIPASGFDRKFRARQIAALGWKKVARLEPPVGIFAKDDIGAMCALNAVAQVGLRVPGEAVVLGVADDIVYCHATSPPLSSLRFPGKAIGRAAAELLYRMMSGETVPDDYRLQVPSPGVVARESTGHVDLPDPVVRRAVEIIRREVGTGQLTADMLAQGSGVSRELLRQRFRKVFGHGPKQEIDRMRARQISEVLRRTDWTVERVALEGGFSGADDLCRFMKRVTGISPGAHRKR